MHIVEFFDIAAQFRFIKSEFLSKSPASHTNIAKLSLFILVSMVDIYIIVTFYSCTVSSYWSAHILLLLTTRFTFKKKVKLIFVLLFFQFEFTLYGAQA